MNVLSSNKFYNQLMESDMFNLEQKIFIKRIYTQCHNEIINKIKLHTKCSAKSGRPSKIKTKESFEEAINYWKKGYIGISLIMKIFNISRGTLFRYAKQVKVKEVNINITKEQRKKIEEIYNRHAWEYAELWTNKLRSKNYQEDMMQDCLTQLWIGSLDYFTNNDEDIKYKMEEVLKNKKKYQKIEEEINNYKSDNELIMKQTMKLLDM